MDFKKFQIDDLFYILKTLFEGNELYYVSTPINTGKRFIDWYVSDGRFLNNLSDKYKIEFEENVIKPNVENAKKNIMIIKQNVKGAIIDPTNLENHTLNWTQEEFYSFWTRVIRELVTNTIFLDGWEFSVGCSYELLSALENKKNLYTQELKILPIDEIILKLENSIYLYSKYNIEYKDKLNVILSKVKNSYEYTKKER